MIQEPKQTRTIVFKYAVLSKIQDKTLIRSNKVLMRLQDSGRWYMCRLDFRYEGWKVIFQNMTQCSADLLYIYLSSNSHILKQIHFPKFTQLKKLILCCNRIQNVEPLTWMKCDKLQFLNMEDNQITHIKCFNKLSMPSLDNLFLDQNQLNEINSLAKARIDSKKIMYLNLQNYSSEKIADLSVLFKLASKGIKNLLIRSKYRILQPKLKMLLISKRDFLRL